MTIRLAKCSGYSRIFTLVKLDYMVNIRGHNIRIITAINEALKFLSYLSVRHVGKVDTEKADKLRVNKHVCPKTP